MSPASAIDITQMLQILYFRAIFKPVLRLLDTAKFSQILVKQNFALAILYNLIVIRLQSQAM
jgi:Cu2+-exporting ATPase